MNTVITYPKRKLGYVYPLLSYPDFGYFRLNGHGLGNLLLVYFKAAIHAKLTQRNLIWPTWPQLKLKTVFEPKRTRRVYNSVFTVPASVDHSMSMRLAAVAGTHFRCIATKLDIEVVSGYSKFFYPFIGHVGQIREWFNEMSVDSMPDLSRYVNSCVLHIRLGDFTPFSNINDAELPPNTSLPPEFFRIAVNEIRKIYKLEHFYVISDASAETLIERGYDYNSWGACVLEGNDPLVDIIILSKAKIRVISNSTFSLWGTFLADGVTYVPKKLPFNKYGIHSLGLNLIEM